MIKFFKIIAYVLFYAVILVFLVIGVFERLGGDPSVNGSLATLVLSLVILNRFGFKTKNSTICIFALLILSQIWGLSLLSMAPWIILIMVITGFSEFLKLDNQTEKEQVIEEK